MNTELATKQDLNVVSDKSAPVTPMALIEVAMQQNADVDRLEKLWELQQKYEQAEARKAYVAAMADFRERCPTINKDSTVDYTSSKGRTNYKHASLAGALAQIKQLESECGLSHSWRTTQNNKVVEVTCVVTHNLGHSESTTLIGEPDPSGGKNAIQAIGSSVTYLQRYTLFALLGLASSEDDIDGNTDALDLNEVISLFEGAETLAKLDSLANHAAKLPNDDKKAAKSAYLKRKEELKGELK